MPWMHIGQLTDEDLKAMFAYLPTLPPVDNRAPQPVLPASAQGSGTAPEAHRSRDLGLDRPSV